MAISIVGKAPSYKFRKQHSTLKTRWSEYGSTAGFVYLLRNQGYELEPPPIASPNFAKALLEQASDTDHIKELFLAYQHLIKVLQTRGYALPPIRLDLGQPLELLQIAEFPEDVLIEIKQYKSPL